jgi:hypothetical protein
LARVGGPERRDRTSRSEQPDELPDVTPPRTALPGHDFTLQAVIEMQRTLGELNAKTDRLITDVDSHGKKLDKVRMQLMWVAGVAAAFGFLLMLAIGAIKTIPWDKM